MFDTITINYPIRIIFKWNISLWRVSFAFDYTVIYWAIRLLLFIILSEGIDIAISLNHIHLNFLLDFVWNKLMRMNSCILCLWWNRCFRNCSYSIDQSLIQFHGDRFFKNHSTTNIVCWANKSWDQQIVMYLIHENTRHFVLSSFYSRVRIDSYSLAMVFAWSFEWL